MSELSNNARENTIYFRDLQSLKMQYDRLMEAHIRCLAIIGEQVRTIERLSQPLEELVAPAIAPTIRMD